MGCLLTEILIEIIQNLDCDSNTSRKTLLNLCVANRFFNTLTTPILTANLNNVLRGFPKPPWEVPTPTHTMIRSGGTINIQLIHYITTIVTISASQAPLVPENFQAWAFRKTAPETPFPIPCTANIANQFHALSLYQRVVEATRACKDGSRSHCLGWIEDIEPFLGVGKGKMYHSGDSFWAPCASCVELKARARTAAIGLRFDKEKKVVWVSAKGGGDASVISGEGGGRG